MSRVHTDNRIINMVKTMVTINILEPITKRSIRKSLKNIDSVQMSWILNELIDSGYITKEKWWYRTTYKGISFSISKKASKLRDIQRMKHLLALSKQRGGDSVGR